MSISLLPFFFFPPILLEDISHYIVPLNYLPPTLVHHLSHHLSICPIKLLLSTFSELWSPRKHCSELYLMHLMWWSQLFSKYFRVFLLPYMFVRHLCTVGTLWRTIIMVRINNWTAFNRSEEEYLIGKLPGYFPHLKS